MYNISIVKVNLKYIEHRREGLIASFLYKHLTYSLEETKLDIVICISFNNECKLYMRNIFLVILVMLLPTLTFSQVFISGKIVDEFNKKPISYINIGILNSTTGTISNKDGSFSIEIADSLINENLLFSAIGYTKKLISIVSIKESKEVVIYLNEKVIDLDEFVISSTSKKIKLKKTWFGNKKRPLFVQGQMHADTISAGGAMTLLIDKTNNDLSYVQKVSLFIARNTLPEFKVRVRFLEVDSNNNNLPGTDIFNKNVVIKSTIKRGWLDFDLKSYNHQIDEPSFYVMIEWILDEKDRKYMNKITNQIIADNQKSMHIDMY